MRVSEKLLPERRGQDKTSPVSPDAWRLVAFLYESGGMRHWFARTSVARVLAAAAWCWLFAAVPFLSDAGCDLFILLALGVSGAVIAIAWLGMTIARPDLPRGQERGPWFSIPLAGFLAVVLLYSDCDLAVRVAMCESSLRRYAETVPAGADSRQAPRWVGLFHVDEVRKYDGAVYLYTSQSFLNRYGVAHIPPGTPLAPKSRVIHLYGNWYKFEWKF